MTIRLAEQGDIDYLVAIHATGFEHGWDRASLLQFVAQDLVLVIADPPQGFVIARQILDEAEILTLVVMPTAQKKGYGAALLSHAIERLFQSNVAAIFLEVASDNKSAIALYERSGFTRSGIRKAYYTRQSGPAIDAIMMTKPLG